MTFHWPSAPGETYIPSPKPSWMVGPKEVHRAFGRRVHHVYTIKLHLLNFCSWCVCSWLKVLLVAELSLWDRWRVPWSGTYHKFVAKPDCLDGPKCRQKSHGVFIALETCKIKLLQHVIHKWAETFVICSMLGIIRSSYIGILIIQMNPNDIFDRRCENVRPKSAKQLKLKRLCRMNHPKFTKMAQRCPIGRICFLA